VAGSMRGPRAKVERAKKHVGELQATLSGLVYSHTNNPDEIVTEDEPQTGNRLYKIGEIPKIPDEIATIAGDTVHNLRASLDLLFGQLVVANGEQVGEDYLPISNTRQKFVTRCKSQIKPRIGEDAFKLICTTEAYRGGKGDALWRVHRLDIEDKHRLLFVVAYDFYSFSPMIPTGVFPDEAMEAFESMGIFLNPARPRARLEEGYVLLTDADTSTQKTDPQFRLDVSFAESEVVQGKPLLPSLVELIQAVEGTVEAFAPLFEPI